MKTLHFLVENGIISWLIWHVGMLVLIAGMLAMYFFKATYLETPLSILIIPLLAYYLHQLEKLNEE